MFAAGHALLVCLVCFLRYGATLQENSTVPLGASVDTSVNYTPTVEANVARSFNTNTSRQDVKLRDNNDTGTADAISALLDGMLAHYDRNLRPNFGGTPLTVAVEFNIRSIGPITEQDMLFSLECYFRQRWRDERLSFDPGLYGNNSMFLTLNVKILDRIWHPDTVIVNGQRSYLHMVPMPNRFFRIHADGLIYYSQRLTIRTRCPMQLENFPLDIQACPLSIGSFGYSESDMRYEWRNGADKSVEIAEDMKLSQFDLIGHPSYNISLHIRGEQHSVLEVRFLLKRRTGYFMLQLYIPCALLVILSWVSFWINREAAADRIALGVMTVLTMTFLGMDNRVDLPKVAYSTALDVYLVMCFTFALATIIQYAIVHSYAERSFHKPAVLNDRAPSADDKEASTWRDRSPVNGASRSRIGTVFCLCRRADRVYAWNRSPYRVANVSLIDKASRILFPLAFSLFNLVYWISYADF